MSEAVICPVCQGRGITYKEYSNLVGYTCHLNEKTCHGCNGKGWVEIGNLSYGIRGYVDE